jgi:hypothetical protein
VIELDGGRIELEGVKVPIACNAHVVERRIKVLRGIGPGTIGTRRMDKDCPAEGNIVNGLSITAPDHYGVLVDREFVNRGRYGSFSGP